MKRQKDLNLQLFIKDIGEIVCSDSNCIIVEIFFVIDTREKLKNGKTTDQSLQKGNYDEKLFTLMKDMTRRVSGVILQKESKNMSSIYFEPQTACETAVNFKINFLGISWKMTLTFYLEIPRKLILKLTAVSQAVWGSKYTLLTCEPFL